jgi:hypothetical protein
MKAWLVGFVTTSTHRASPLTDAGHRHDT